MDELPGFLPGCSAIDGVGGKADDSAAYGKDRLLRNEPQPRLKTINRKQLLLRPVDVERLVSDDHEVRAIWEFAGHLDLTLYYRTIHAVEGKAGCTAFDPRLLLSIWIYAYSKGVGSAREISRLCDHDPAYQWLTGMEPINYHTLAAFRSSHKESLDRLFVEVLGIMSAEGLITLERVMHDGTKVKALADRSSFRREEKIREHLKAAEEQVKQSPDEEASLRVQKAQERAAQEKKKRMDKALQELKKIRAMKSEKKEAKASVTDPDARIMIQSDGGYAPSYNVQLSTDAAAGIIIGVGVGQRSDADELMPAVERIKENVGKTPRQVVADGGYTNWENVVAMDGAGIDFIGSVPDRAAQRAGRFEQRGVEEAFRPEHFVYDEQSDTYTCPEGKILRRHGRNIYTGWMNLLYRPRGENCASCPHKEQCCPGHLKRRQIARSVYDPAIVSFMEKMKTEAAKEIYKQRAPIAEFPHAWIKEKLGLRQFHLRGLLKVGMEALWVCLTYNIQQWIRLSWRPRLAKAGM